MRYLLNAVLLFAMAVPCIAQEAGVVKAKAAAALQLAAAERQRHAQAAREACSLAKDLLASAQNLRDEHAACMTDLPAAKAKADEENRPLFVWVGITCQKDIRKAFGEAVHCHVTTLNGKTSPRLVVSPPRKEWGITFPPTVDAHQIPAIRAYVPEAAKKISAAETPQPQTYTAAPIVTPPVQAYRAAPVLSSRSC